MRGKLLLWLLVVALVVGNIVTGYYYINTAKELEGTKVVLSTQRYNEPTLNFLKLFIKRVIKSDKEVDFETRLKLENAVRELGDPQILVQWQKFVNSQTESETQQNVKDLLELLVDKVYLR